MPTAQPGDRVLVRYTIRPEDGAPAFRRPGSLLELTVGADHPHLPGLALAGLAPGDRVALAVAPGQAYGPYDPARIYRLSRARFTGCPPPVPGKRLRITDGRGRRRRVRVLRADDRAVLVDTNHPLAGRALNVEVEVLAVRPAGAPARGAPPPGRPRALAFGVDPASLDCLRQALPGWEVRDVPGATADSLSRTWDPAQADLLVVGLGERVSEGLGLCRFLAFCSPYAGDARQAAGGRPGPGAGGTAEGPPVSKADAPLLVLIPPGHEALVRPALAAGAHSCLTLPVHPKEVASMLTHARAGDQPGRHTLGSERAQLRDPWRDDGGEG
jgi:FKBP-type peptidyl-prolyl cis-trans isomerase 2